MSHGYSARIRGILGTAAANVSVKLDEGVYAAMNGPAYETPAEIRMLGVLGADMVGMSTVPEALAANEVGLEVAAIAAISNRAAGLSSEPLTHDDVQVVAGIASKNLADILEQAIPRF
jgi:purine-nucleoside phosphorylase